MKNCLLAIDTATEACSVAVWRRDGIAGATSGQVVAARHAVDPRGHTRLLLPMVQSALQETGLRLQDMDGLVCTRGPGSFTGVRVGVSAVQGLAFALDLPVMPVSTLQLLAWQGSLLQADKTRWQVAMDARMNEVYWAEFTVQGGGLIPVGAESLLAPEAIPLQFDEMTGHIGTGWALTNAPAVAGALDTALPDAAALASLAGAMSNADWVAAEALQPVYLRDKVTHSQSR